MSTAGKSSFRKDGLDTMRGIFQAKEEQKAALENEMNKKEQIKDASDVPEQKTVTETTIKEKPKKTKPEKGRGDKKSEISGSDNKNSVVFKKKEKKKENSAKSVYLSNKNIEFIQEISENNNIPFSEVLNQIIENFRDNM